MARKADTSINVAINSNHCPMIYYPIDDGDNESVIFYKSNGCAVKSITLNGKSHYFALVPAKTQMQASLINRELYFFHQEEQLRLQQKKSEMSYEQMIEKYAQAH